MQISDVRGALKLAVQATTGVTRMVEGVHQSVWDRLGVPGGQVEGSTRGVTGTVYQLINGIANASGSSADALLALLQEKVSVKDSAPDRSAAGEKFISILNGVVGGQLAHGSNPLALSMSLRYGNLMIEDWNGHDRFKRKPDSRSFMPLPESTHCFSIAATLSEKRGILSDPLVGDGLVPLRSALGQHSDDSRNHKFAPDRQRVVYRTGHLELLDSAEVNEQIIQWLIESSSANVDSKR